MPETLEKPPAPPEEPRSLKFLSKDEDVRSLQVGGVLTAIIWLLLLSAVFFETRFIKNNPEKIEWHRQKPTFSIEMAPEEFIMPEKPKTPPDRYVEANPDAPENVPDKTRNFAAQNQQAAQEVPDPNHKNDTPSTKGKKDMESNQIVTGNLHTPETEPPAEVPPPSPEMMQAIKEAQQQREQNPLAGDQKLTGDSATGYGFNLGKKAEHYDDVAEKVEGNPLAPLIVGLPQATVPKVDPRRPMPRPRLEVRTRPAVLVDRPEGTSNVGITAYDARWSEYGQYLKRLQDTVQIEWEKVLETTKAMPPPGSSAKVRFRIDGKEGAIVEILEQDGNGGKQFTLACVAGITNRSPYGKWTDEMLAVLGESQEMTFTFYIY